MIIVDAHLDIAFNAVLRHRDVTKPAIEQPVVDNEIATVGLPDLRAGNVGLVCATIFCQPKTDEHPGYTSADEAQVQAWDQMQWYLSQMKAGLLDLVTSRDDLSRTTGILPVSDTRHGQDARGTTEAIILLEGADAIRSLEDVKMWFDLGLRIVGLTWAKSSRFAGGNAEPGPLTAAGIELVEELDSFGIIHDISHLSERSFWQLLDTTAGPIISSHSNCRAIVPGERQISDDMIKAIAQHGGIMGINFFDRFLLPPDQYGKRRATLDDVVAHVKRMCDLVGSADHVGLGTDMDGGLGREQIPKEIVTSGDLPRVAEALSAAGFDDSAVQGILGQNWLEFFRSELPASG